MKKTVLILALCITSIGLFANNVQITNLTKSGSTITFDLSWENSWYAGLSYHDAVWIFVKQAVNGGPSWQHAHVTSATVDAGYFADIPSDEVGFFVRRLVTGNGTATTSVSADLTGLVGAFQDVKVMAVEMVYIPVGDFYAGDGASQSRIARGDDVLEPVHIISDLVDLTCGSAPSDIQYSSGSCTDIPSSFPKGFAAFYCMKYGITQRQYVDFLNCLGRSQQENRVAADVTGTTVTNIYVMADSPTQSKGNVIRCDENIGYGPITFYCDRNNNGVPNEADDGMFRACNFLSTADWKAYLDWSGLRPMSFLEIEKASRGPLPPVQNEYSWGSSLWTNNGTLENAGTESEKWSNSYIDGGISTYADDVIRVGANAPSSGATRELSNASYYGVIDLGNNPSDFYIHKDDVLSFSAVEGDGALNTAGDANVAEWPTLDPTITQYAKLSLQTHGISSLTLGTIGNTATGGGRGVRSNF